MKKIKCDHCGQIKEPEECYTVKIKKTDMPTKFRGAAKARVCEECAEKVGDFLGLEVWKI